ncbi:MAG TPA: hypothetical protein VHE30_23090 [Polyangiaceae bacterium]|nr:hypothetical protein [Polyangiaceae bacterium]
MTVPSKVANVAGNAAKLLPVLAVAVVLYAVLVAGRVRPVDAARLRGGPTEGATRLSYRVEVVARDGEGERPRTNLGVVLEATAAGLPMLAARGVTDGEGAVSLSLTAPRAIASAVTLRVRSEAGAVLLEQPVRVSVADWAGNARRRGGWVEGRAVNGLSVRVAAARGVFAVPFQDSFVVDVRRAGGTFDGQVTCRCPGPRGESPTETTLFPATGRTLPLAVPVLPLEHATDVSLVATDADGTRATLDVSLAVVPGALHAEATPQGVLVESPIVRDVAYVALVTERERIAGGTVRLAPTPRGTSSGVFETPLPPDRPLYAVVSSEPDLRSPALVGWPIATETGAGPPRTLDVPDVLAADGVVPRFEAELSRARRARFFSGGVAGAALLLSALLVARRAKLAKDALSVHLAESGMEGDAAARAVGTGGAAVWVVLVSILVLVLGAMLVGFFAAAL